MRTGTTGAVADDLVVDVRDGSPAASRQPPRAGGRPARQGRRPRDFTATDVWMLVGSAVSALCFNWLVFARFADGVSPIGFAICSYAVFILLFWVVTADRLGRLVAMDRVMTVVVISAGFVVLVPLVLLIGYILVEGLKALRLAFFVKDQTSVTPLLPATAGGGAHAIVGTIEQVGLALLWSLPLGLAAAVFLNESRSRSGGARSGSSSTP